MNDKTVLADLSVEEVAAFQRSFSRKAALKEALKTVTESLAEEQAKEDEMWTRTRERYNIPNGPIHINCTTRKIYAGYAD